MVLRLVKLNSPVGLHHFLCPANLIILKGVMKISA